MNWSIRPIGRPSSLPLVSCFWFLKGPPSKWWEQVAAAEHISMRKQNHCSLVNESWQYQRRASPAFSAILLIGNAHFLSLKSTPKSFEHSYQKWTFFTKKFQNILGYFPASFRLFFTKLLKYGLFLSTFWFWWHFLELFGYFWGHYLVALIPIGVQILKIMRNLQGFLYFSTQGVN